MSKHIELVKKWLANPDSVTQEELKQNCADAYAAVYADADVAAYSAAYVAYWAADADAVYRVAYWVKRYEALENDDE